MASPGIAPVSGPEAPASARKNVIVLSASQALAMTGMSMVMTASALVGKMLTPDPSMATFPLALQFAGAMMTTIPASLFMGKYGRRLGFSIGQCVGALGGALAAYAIYSQNFWLFAGASLLLGFHVAFWQYYRFAAADSAGPEFRAKAISYVLAGGVVAAVAGPELAKWGEKLFAPVLFAGIYIIIAGLCLITLVFLQAIRIPAPSTVGIIKGGRPLAEIMRQPVFIVAVMTAMLGYGTMTLVMTATPLAMEICGFAFGESATVIQWHILAMYAPSFFTGNLIKRFGVLNIILSGIILVAFAMAINLSGIDYLNFSAGLVCLGLGWNFMFIGGTTLLTDAYRTAERPKVQAANDFMVLSTTTLAAFSSGALQHSIGWAAVNAGIAIPMTLVFVSVTWYKFIFLPKRGL